MKPTCAGLFAVAVVLLAADPAATDDKDKGNKLPESALKVLQNATEFELYSIDFAHPDKEKTGFHDLKAVGKTTVKDAKTREKLVSEFPREPIYRNDLAWTLYTEGGLLAATRPQDAEKAYRRALEIGEKLVSESPAVPDYQFVVGHR